MAEFVRAEILGTTFETTSRYLVPHGTYIQKLTTIVDMRMYSPSASALLASSGMASYILPLLFSSRRKELTKPLALLMI